MRENSFSLATSAAEFRVNKNIKLAWIFHSECRKYWSFNSNIAKTSEKYEACFSIFHSEWEYIRDLSKRAKVFTNEWIKFILSADGDNKTKANTYNIWYVRIFHGQESKKIFYNRHFFTIFALIFQKISRRGK